MSLANKHRPKVMQLQDTAALRALDLPLLSKVERQPARVNLRPARLADRRTIYDWLARSDATSQMMGPPRFCDHPVPSFEEFADDFDESAFTEAGPFRLFVILADSDEVGAICYFVNGVAAEVDIWIGASGNWGRGIGSAALGAILDLLVAQTSVSAAVIRPSARNKRAVRAYLRAGFTQYDPVQHQLPDWCLNEGFDYHDAVVLVRSLERSQRPMASFPDK